MGNTLRKLYFVNNWKQPFETTLIDLKYHTPNHDAIWKDLTYTTSIEEADYFVLLEGLSSELKGKIDLSRTILIRLEPSWVKSIDNELIQNLFYNMSYDTDFGTAMWWTFTPFNVFNSMPYQKSKHTSCLISSKTMTEGHRVRLEFFKRYLVDKLIDLGFGEDKEYARRLSKEYLVISRLGVIEYFLIVEDLFRFTKSQGVLCHTRGSVNGSLVAFLLGLGVVDPILHGILFERFLSPARLLTGRSDIDIDCDFEAEFRGEAIAYLRRKYGESSVCQVGSYNRLQLRAGIKDMARIEHETSG
ncbi:hypothetical protein LCGC14_2479370, partial [marine sediment metagenome]